MLMPVNIIGRDLDDTWFQLLKELRAQGREYKITNGSLEWESRLTFDMCSGFIAFPHVRPLAPITEPLNPPTSDIVIEKYFQEYIMNPNLLPGEEYRYSQWINGPYMNHWKPNKIEGYGHSMYETQLEWIIRHFNEKGYGNEHCFITVGDPDTNFRYDKPYEDDTDRGTSPCLRGLDFRVINDGGVNLLLTNVLYRSWDLVAGWPENMGGFTLLNEYVAGMIGVEPGPLAFNCKSLHAYKSSLKYLDQRIGIKYNE